MIDAGSPQATPPGRPPGDGVFHRAPARVALASALLFLSSLLWAALAPDFRTPDELQHVNSVVRVAEGGGWPRPREAHLTPALVRAGELSGATVGGRRTVFPGGLPTPPEAPSFADVVPSATGDRASFEELGRRPAGGLTLDQMTQHPPGYYGVAAVVYDLVGAGEWRYDRAVFLLRALTALLIAATVPACCYVAGWHVSGRESVGTICAFVPLLVPQLQFVGGGVTNDGAAIAAASGIWALLLTMTTSGPTRRRLVGLAVVVAAACWSKGTALSLLPCIPVGIAVAYHRARGGPLRRWAPPALAATVGTLGLAFVLGGWWWALNLVRYDRLQPSGMAAVPRDDARLDLGEFFLVFVRRIRWTFFGEVGVREPRVFGALTLALAVLVVALCVAGLLSGLRWADRLLMLLGICVPVGVLFATTYSAHRATTLLPGIQGRYLFVLIVPVAVLFTCGAVSGADRLRIPVERLLPVFALAGTGVAALGLLLGFRVFYAFPGRSTADAWDLFLRWAAWPPAAIAGLLGAFALCGVALVWSLRRPAPGNSSGIPALE